VAPCPDRVAAASLGFVGSLRMGSPEAAAPPVTSAVIVLGVLTPLFHERDGFFGVCGSPGSHVFGQP